MLKMNDIAAPLPWGKTRETENHRKKVSIRITSKVIFASRFCDTLHKLLPMLQMNHIVAYIEDKPETENQRRMVSIRVTKKVVICVSFLWYITKTFVMLKINDIAAPNFRTTQRDRKWYLSESQARSFLRLVSVTLYTTSRSVKDEWYSWPSNLRTNKRDRKS